MINVDLCVFFWDWMAAVLDGTETSVNTTCSLYNQTLLPAGSNPKSTQRYKIWQINVFHFVWSPHHWYFFRFSMGNPLSWEQIELVITHFLEIMTIRSIPAQIKTDNSPAYVSKKMKQFFAYYNAKCITGIPHNPTGQIVIERSNRTIKDILNNRKG